MLCSGFDRSPVKFWNEIKCDVVFSVETRALEQLENVEAISLSAVSILKMSDFLLCRTVGSVFKYSSVHRFA